MSWKLCKWTFEFVTYTDPNGQEWASMIKDEYYMIY